MLSFIFWQNNLFVNMNKIKVVKKDFITFHFNLV
jgi:hypothetical protein